MDGSSMFPASLADQFNACDRAQFARERAELADSRRKGLRLSTKMYQASVVRFYLRLRRDRRISA